MLDNINVIYLKVRSDLSQEFVDNFPIPHLIFWVVYKGIIAGNHLANFGHVIYVSFRRKLRLKLAQFPLIEIEFTLEIPKISIFFFQKIRLENDSKICHFPLGTNIFKVLTMAVTICSK